MKLENRNHEKIPYIMTSARKKSFITVLQRICKRKACLLTKRKIKQFRWKNCGKESQKINRGKKCKLISQSAKLSDKECLQINKKGEVRQFKITQNNMHRSQKIYVKSSYMKYMKIQIPTKTQHRFLHRMRRSREFVDTVLIRT